MNGNKAVLDSNAIIYASKQMIDVGKLLAAYDEFYVSIITYMEVYAYEFENADEKALIDELFDALEIVEIPATLLTGRLSTAKTNTKRLSYLTQSF